MSESRSPVVVEPIVSAEKLGELLRLQTEYPELDFKRSVDLRVTGGVVELAKDVGAMQVRGGFIVVGVDEHGVPTGECEHGIAPMFDEANLVPKLLAYLPEPLELRSRAFQLDGKTVILLFVGPHPSGCAFFHADGKYPKNGKDVVRFRAGDVFYRDGTRSVRLTQHGFEEVVKHRIQAMRASWFDEHQEIRRREIEDLRGEFQSGRLAQAPLGAIGFHLDAQALSTAVLELVRQDDEIALRHLFQEAAHSARVLLEAEEFDTEIGDLVDKLVCLAATLLVYRQPRWFECVIESLVAIYELGFASGGEGFEYHTQIDPRAKSPRLWLLVIERVFGLGGLAVRLKNWAAVRTLTLQHPEAMGRHYKNWLRHALTMAARAQHLQRRENEQVIEISLISLARGQADRLECLRSDGVRAGDDAILTSITQFDILSNVIAIADAKAMDSSVFYPNFARFYTHRVQPIVVRLLSEGDMRQILFPLEDEELATGLQEINRTAIEQGFRHAGFSGFDDARITKWIAEHLPRPKT